MNTIGYGVDGFEIWRSWVPPHLHAQNTGVDLSIIILVKNSSKGIGLISRRVRQKTIHQRIALFMVFREIRLVARRKQSKCCYAEHLAKMPQAL